MNRKNIFLMSIVLCLSMLFSQCNNQNNNKASLESNIEEEKSEIKDSTEAQMLSFNIDINAPADKVYQVMTDSTSFTDWTHSFGASSSYIGNWEKDSKIIFLSNNDEGYGQGMVSHIINHIPNELISIEHRGMVKDGLEIMEGEEVDSFKGSRESYSISNDGTKTTVTIKTDVFIAPDSFFIQTWPMALQRIKELAEAQ